MRNFNPGLHVGADVCTYGHVTATLPLVINYYALLELKDLVKSVRTSHAYNFLDMWKMKVSQAYN